MSALVFLGIAAVIAVIGGVAVALFHDRSDAPTDDGVGQFKRIMDALAPDEAEAPRGVSPAPTDATPMTTEAEG